MTPVSVVGGYQFPAVWVDVRQLHVAFAGILEAQHWATLWAVSYGLFTVQEVLGDASIIHTVHIPKPSQSTLTED